jgi:hypothetical protein
MLSYTELQGEKQVKSPSKSVPAASREAGETAKAIELLAAKLQESFYDAGFQWADAASDVAWSCRSWLRDLAKKHM